MKQKIILKFNYLKSKTLLISILLILGDFQINAQKSDIATAPCVSLANVKQECNQNGTVDISFGILIDINCISSGFTVKSRGFEQSITTDGIITHDGVSPGEKVCYDIVVHGDREGTECCIMEVCLDVICCNMEGCCDLKAEVEQLSCGPGFAHVRVSGGTSPYFGPGIQIGENGDYFIVLGLESGEHTLSFKDDKGCKAAVTFDLAPSCCDNFVAEILDRECDWVHIKVTGGRVPYIGGGTQIGFDEFIFEDLAIGPHTLTFEDNYGCEVDVMLDIPDDLETEIVDSSCGPNGWVHLKVSGGTVPYEVPGIPIGFDEFEIEGLDIGIHSWIIKDYYGCEVVATFTVEESPQVASINTINANCAAGTISGGVAIEIYGGIPPYKGPQNQESDGEFFYYDLSVDDYDWSFYDTNECEVIVSFTIDYEDADAVCEDFNFEADEEDNSDVNFYQESFTSDISATIFVSLEAYNVQDRLFVYVDNELVVEILAGTSTCAGISDFNPEKEFSIVPCNVVEFIVHGDDCPEATSLWDLSVRCLEDRGDTFYPNSDLSSTRSSSKISSDRYNQELRMNSEQLVEIFPNPATDILNINISDRLINYQTAKIISSAGNVIHTEDMSRQNKLQIDASAFPQGLYFIEMIDHYGNRIIKKFTK